MDSSPLNNSTLISRGIPGPEDLPLPTDRGPLFVVMPVISIYVVIFVIGVLGNVITCLVIARNRSMRTATNYYLFSLAVSDFLLLVSGVPQEINVIWHRYPPIYGGDFTCILRALVAEVSGNATVLIIAAFTVERYLAICHPFLAHTLSKPSRAVRLILVIWAVSFGLALVQALAFRLAHFQGHPMCVVADVYFEHFFELSTFLFFCVPMALITVLYILIGCKLRMRSGNQLGRATELQRRHGSTSRSQRRVLKMLVAVVVAFILCWAPFHGQRLYATYVLVDVNSPVDAKVQLIYEAVTYVSGVLYYLSACINPLLYSIMSHKFRQAFKALLFRRQSIGTRAFLNNAIGTRGGLVAVTENSSSCRKSTRSQPTPILRPSQPSSLHGAVGRSTSRGQTELGNNNAIEPKSTNFPRVQAIAPKFGHEKIPFSRVIPKNNHSIAIG